MSGGVDSSVAAALLVEQGYDVVGMMMRLWSEPDGEHQLLHNRCCTPQQMADARRVADLLQIPFYVIDVKDFFRETIVQFFIDEHAKGRTPNPCVECNRTVRFTYLFEHTLALDATYMATGHYARVHKRGERYQLLTAVDQEKDQSYVLHVLSQKELAHAQFPVGDYTKSEVRQLAVKFNLPVAQKGESMDLCFLSDGDYRRFLFQYAPQSMRPGPIFTDSGEVLGQHTGLPNYTIGQRKGLGVATGSPLYVLRKDEDRNALVVGSHDELGRKRLNARNVNWVAGCSPSGPTQLNVKIRYKAKPLSGIVSPVGEHLAEIVLDDPANGITAGQSVVFYDDNICLGGGIISDEANA
jgi:tRNA-specific 2-thiouridylase